MTIGSGIYYPGGRFAFPRSYIKSLCIEVTAADVTYVDGTVTFSNPTQTFVIVFKPNFIDWSSNRYTLDYIVDQSFYRNTPDPTELPMAFALSYFHDSLNNPSINFQPFGINFPDKHFFDLPPAPPDYWLPPWNE